MIQLLPIPVVYFSKEASKVFRRASAEWAAEWPHLCDKWKIIVAGFLFQYLHGVGAKSAHYLHHPGPILHDVGFELLPELGKQRAFWSEWIFLTVVVPFVLWTFRPFFASNKRFYTALLWSKVLTILCICQFCRVISFTATQLPGPNYHCREGSPLATLPPLKHITELFMIDLSKAGMFGCGDLIFSSHMTFTLTAVLTYCKYGTAYFLKILGWFILIIQSLLIISSRKHYSVDVVVAWYTVPLVFYFVDHGLSEYVGQGEPLDLRGERLGERTVSAPLLPIRNEMKEVRPLVGSTGSQD